MELKHLWLCGVLAELGNSSFPLKAEPPVMLHVFSQNCWEFVKHNKPTVELAQSPCTTSHTSYMIKSKTLQQPLRIPAIKSVLKWQRRAQREKRKNRHTPRSNSPPFVPCNCCQTTLCSSKKYKSQPLYWKIQLFIVNPLSLHGE